MDKTLARPTLGESFQGFSTHLALTFALSSEALIVCHISQNFFIQSAQTFITTRRTAQMIGRFITSI